MSVSIKPLEDRVVIKTLEAEQTTASGLVIPDTAKEKPQEGEVLAVGPGRVDDNGNRVPLDVAVGDTVVYSKYGGTEVSHGGDDLLILSARDILAIVEKGFAGSAMQAAADGEGPGSGDSESGPSASEPMRVPWHRCRCCGVVSAAVPGWPSCGRWRSPMIASRSPRAGLAQLAAGIRLDRISARSSSDKPPQTPYGSRTFNACSRHCWITG